MPFVYLWRISWLMSATSLPTGTRAEAAGVLPLGVAMMVEFCRTGDVLFEVAA